MAVPSGLPRAQQGDAGFRPGGVREQAPRSAGAACCRALYLVAGRLSRLLRQDGSCNGLQHYAALARDQDGGRAVNLMPGEAPADVYRCARWHGRACPTRHTDACAAEESPIW